MQGGSSNQKEEVALAALFGDGTIMTFLVHAYYLSVCLHEVHNECHL
jgi:hypothetical protein